jgi:hypothetical protein
MKIVEAIIRESDDQISFHQHVEMENGWTHIEVCCKLSGGKVVKEEKTFIGEDLEDMLKECTEKLVAKLFVQKMREI